MSRSASLALHGQAVKHGDIAASDRRAESTRAHERVLTASRQLPIPAIPASGVAGRPSESTASKEGAHCRARGRAKKSWIGMHASPTETPAYRTRTCCFHRSSGSNQCASRGGTDLSRSWAVAARVPSAPDLAQSDWSNESPCLDQRPRKSSCLCKPNGSSRPTMAWVCRSCEYLCVRGRSNHHTSKYAALHLALWPSRGGSPKAHQWPARSRARLDVRRRLE